MWDKSKNPFWMASLTLIFTLVELSKVPTDLVKISVKEATHMGFYYITWYSPLCLLMPCTVRYWNICRHLDKQIQVRTYIANHCRIKISTMERWVISYSLTAPGKSLIYKARYIINRKCTWHLGTSLRFSWHWMWSSFLLRISKHWFR